MKLSSKRETTSYGAKNCTKIEVNLQKSSKKMRNFAFGSWQIHAGGITYSKQGEIHGKKDSK